jgi:prepilin-type N-terminal cleavage/methylation domain-containing protein
MTRRGTTLVELIVALAIGVLLASAFTGVLIGQRRSEAATAIASRRFGAADEVVRVVASALGRVASVDTIWMRGDTAIEWRATIGTGLSCAAAGDSVAVPDGGAAAWWEAAPDSGDVAELLDAGGGASRIGIVGATFRSGGACGGSQRTLRLRDSVPATGARVVRVTRRVRQMLYRGGEGLWWLGQRTCDDGVPARCGAAQPVAGPLSPNPRGLRIALDSGSIRRLITITATSGTASSGAAVVVQR